MSHSPPGGEQGNIERRALAGEPVGNAQQIERHGAEPIVFAVPGPQESTVEALDLEIWSILPAVASPSGAAAARSPSSESPDALGDACPVLTCQKLDSLVAKCQARAAVTAQRGCKFPQKEQSRPMLTPPVVAGLEDLAEMLGAGRTQACRNGGRPPTIGGQVHPHFSCSAHRGHSISGASRQARARALCVHIPAAPGAQISV